MIRTQDRWPLFALAFLFLATAAWWALALWPLPTDTPAWLERTRAVCFNVTESGLPDPSGWILLVGQPVGMVAALLVGWRRETVDALRHLASTGGGRLLGGAATIAVAVGVSAAAARVAGAQIPEPELPGAAELPETYPRLDKAFPEVPGLVDQHGRPFGLASLGGRGALVTFAFAHCETICPLLVRSALTARAGLAGEVDLTVVAVTLDPWRDTPGRLPDMANQWELPADAFVVSGSVEAVEAALDAWNVARVRDEQTGDVTHPALVYLVEPDGTVAYASTGAPSQLQTLARRLRH